MLCSFVHSFELTRLRLRCVPVSKTLSRVPHVRPACSMLRCARLIAVCCSRLHVYLCRRPLRDRSTTCSFGCVLSTLTVALFCSLAAVLYSQGAISSQCSTFIIDDSGTSFVITDISMCDGVALLAWVPEGIFWFCGRGTFWFFSRVQVW